MTATRPDLPPGLLRAYRQTRYAASGVVVQIGRRSAAMDTLLVRYGVPSAVWITAWNPFSRPMPLGWNRRMQARLAERLHRLACLPGSGGFRRWREDHLLVLGPVPPVLGVARRFRQNAVVVVRRGQPARLVRVMGRRGRGIGNDGLHQGGGWC